MAFFTKGVFAEDPWADIEIVTIPEWEERRSDTRYSSPARAPLALKLDPGFAIESIAQDLEKFELVKIGFPKFTDGRGYSMGWLLRTRFAYHGEMRAVGDILFDEIQFMVRCGFDSFEIIDPETLRLLQDGRGIAAFEHFYQPGLEPEVHVGTRPWARRLAARQNGNPS